MKASRRDLLRHFGIGAIIAPIIGGSVVRSEAAELIETPKIRPVELFSKIPAPLELANVTGAQVTMTMKDGQTRTIELTQYPMAHGRVTAADRLTANITFYHVAQDASPRAELHAGGIYANAVLL